MKLYKWPETENLYKQDNNYQEAMVAPDTQWVVTEKIDGTNIGLNIFKDSFIFNSRNNIRGPLDSFYNLYMNVHLVQDVITKLQKEFFSKDSLIERVIVYGEYFGKKIMNRIDYKIDYDFRFFSLQIVSYEDCKIILSFRQFEKIFNKLNLQKFIVPRLGYFSTFERAIQYPNDEPSTFNPNVKMEGIVIQPYNRSISYKGKYTFLFKNKNAEFEERTGRTSKIPMSIPVEDLKKIRTLKEIFRTYCTESRMYSVISKLYKPSSEKDFKDFIKPYLEDAYQEFMEDNKQVELTDKERKVITNVGSDIFIIFTKVLGQLNKGEK